MKTNTAQKIRKIESEESRTCVRGGSLTDANTGATVNVRDDASYALAVDIGLDRQKQVQLFYSHQQSALSSETFAPTVNNFGLAIDYYHVGGTYFFEEAGAGGYVVGGIGATHARPDRGDLNSETFLSGNLGVGYMVPLGKHVGLRFEARGYGTLINNNNSMFSAAMPVASSRSRATRCTRVRRWRACRAGSEPTAMDQGAGPIPCVRDARTRQSRVIRTCSRAMS